MDADERLMSLKKAYADIILNTAKEAATRIMVSEKRALHYQHELQATKEDTLRMLLRLKQLMDSKIKEAEAASWNQRKKIEELEAQLHEAEDIVRDLREELREVQAEVGRLKNYNMKHVNEPDNACAGELLEESRVYHYQSSISLAPGPQHASAVVSDVRIPFLNQKSEAQKCCDKIVCTCNLYTGNPDLPSIILRSKERGLYKNGFTQRIRACGRNLVHKESTLSGKSKNVTEDTVQKENEESKNMCTSPAGVAAATSCLEKELLADIKFSSFKSSFRKRKRAIRRRKSITPSCKNHPDSFHGSDQVRELRLRTDQNSVKDNASSSENSLKMDPTLSSERKLDLTEPDDAHNRTYIDEGSSEDIIPSRQETGSAESLDCKMDNEKVDTYLAKLECKPSDTVDTSLARSECKPSDTVNGVPGQSTGERIIKYTFQRKRKRQPLSVSEVNVSLATDTLERKTGNKQDGPQDLELDKSSSIKESSRDSRRLVQVARQLLSLSEKRWH